MAASRTRHAIADPHMFSPFDDDAMLKYILATHAADGTYFDIKPFLEIIENIVHTANQANQAAELGSIVERRFIPKGINEILKAMALTINKVSCEISGKCMKGGDAHTTTMEILNMLSNYAWDSKAVITLSASAMKYAEFWLVAQLYISNSNPLAKSLTRRLRQFPDMRERGEALKPLFEAVSNLIKAMLDLTHCIIEFKMLPEQYISPETPGLVIATSHIPTAVYWIIRSTVACTSILLNLIGKGQQHMIMKTTDGWELSSFARKISNFQDKLRNQLVLCYQHIEEKRQTEAYQTILRIMDTPHLDNITPLKHLIYLKDDLKPLYESSTKTRVSIEILKKKIVLLLISDLDLSMEELWFLSCMYREARKMYTSTQYEIVWLPMVPNDMETPFTEACQHEFEQLQGMIPGYSVYHPSLLKPAVIKYIKEVLHFNHEPLLVVMDPQGKIVNTNALHMMRIWGSISFPFTSQREGALWGDETWSLMLLLGGFMEVPGISKLIRRDGYVYLYGGEDIEWIRKFTHIAQEVARAAMFPLEMLYVGKSKPREKVRKINDIIQNENLSHILPDLQQIWYFWARLESMLYSKLKHWNSRDLDAVLQGIILMLTYDGNDQDWAVIMFPGWDSNLMRQGNGETVLTAWKNYDDWKDDVGMKGFLPALSDYLKKISSPHHCNRLVLPGTTGPDRVVCAECGRLMERFVMYQCCVD